MDRETGRPASTGETAATAQAVMRLVSPDAPRRVHELWHDRAETNLTGTCPVCGTKRAEREGLVLHHPHAPDCPVGDAPELAEWAVADSWVLLTLVAPGVIYGVPFRADGAA